MSASTTLRPTVPDCSAPPRQAGWSRGRVECLAGPVRVQMRGKAGFYLGIAGRTFKLPVRPWHVQSDAHYRVYLAPRANVIVAMEPGGVGEKPK